jgi:hypothetical protein
VRTVRVVSATVVLLMATPTVAQFPDLATGSVIAHGTRVTFTGQKPADVPARWYATPDYEPFIDGLEALKQTHENHVTHALTAIDAFGTYIEDVHAAEAGLIPSELIPVDVALWERLHKCEQSDTWYANGTNSTSSSGMVFQGGLGMAVGAWQTATRAAAARGVTLPRSAMESSPYQQMVGAQAFHDAYGWAWACHV